MIFVSSVKIRSSLPVLLVMPKGAWYVEFVSKIWLEDLALSTMYSSVTK